MLSTGPGQQNITKPGTINGSRGHSSPPLCRTLILSRLQTPPPSHLDLVTICGPGSSGFPPSSGGSSTPSTAEGTGSRLVTQLPPPRDCTSPGQGTAGKPDFPPVKHREQTLLLGAALRAVGNASTWCLLPRNPSEESRCPRGGL